MFRMRKKKILYFSFLAVLLTAVIYMNFTEAEGTAEFVKNSLAFGTVLLPIIFIPLYLCIWQEDFSSRVVNNILISGISRIQHYITKLNVIYFFGILFVTGYNLTVFAGFYLAEGEFPVEMIWAAGIQMLLYMVVLTLGLMLYILVESVALSTAVYVLFVLLFENVFKSLLMQMNINTHEIGQYFLFQNLSRAADVTALSVSERGSILIGSVVVWAVAVCIGVLTLRGREYK